MNSKVLSATDKHHSVEEYLRSEKNGHTKNEFRNGKIIASNGSSRRHSLIGSNITIAIGSRLKRHKCEIYAGSMNVKIGDKKFGYPDIVVVKGEPKFHGRGGDVLINPSVIVEITSNKSMLEDKTEKLDCYLALESVSEYLLVNESKVRVEHYSKQNQKHFSYRIYDQHDEMISLDSIGCKTAVSELYAKVH